MGSVYSAEYQELIQRLKVARQDSGLTQVEVAAKFRQPQSFVSKVESGERRIDPIELKRFAAIYGKPISYFLRAKK